MAEIHPSEMWHSQTVGTPERVCAFLTALQTMQAAEAKVTCINIGGSDIWVIFYPGQAPYKGRGW